MVGDVDAVCAMLHNNASLVNEPSTMRTLLTPLHVVCEHGNTVLIEVKYRRSQWFGWPFFDHPK